MSIRTLLAFRVSSYGSIIAGWWRDTEADGLQIGQRPLHDQLHVLVVEKEVGPNHGLEPVVLLGQHLGIPADNQPIPRSSESHVQPPAVMEKPDADAFVGASAGQNDKILLTALEGVHTSYLDALVA